MQIAARRSTYKKHGKRSVLYKAIRKIEKAEAQVRAKVELRVTYPKQEPYAAIPHVRIYWYGRPHPQTKGLNVP